MSETSLVFQNRSEMNVIFVHSELDDRRLDMAEFRIYCHLARRAGTGTAFPGIDSMAEICRMAKGTVIKAVKTLEASGMIMAERAAGQTTRYILTAKSKWAPLPVLDTPTTSPNEVTHRSKSGNATSPNEVTKGNPIKVIQEGHPAHSASKAQPKIGAPEKRGRMTSPTLDEVKARARAEGLPESEAENFFNYYEANGWRMGRTAMHRWGPALAIWKRRIEERKGRKFLRPTEHDAGKKPFSQRPPPGETEAGDAIPIKEWEKRYPLRDYDTTR